MNKRKDETKLVRKLISNGRQDEEIRKALIDQFNISKRRANQFIKYSRSELPFGGKTVTVNVFTRHKLEQQKKRALQ